MFSKNCKVCLHIVHLDFKSCAVVIEHPSLICLLQIPQELGYLISFRSNVAGVISPTGSYIELIKLSNPLFVNGLFQKKNQLGGLRTYFFELPPPQ